MSLNLWRVAKQAAGVMMQNGVAPRVAWERILSGELTAEDALLIINPEMYVERRTPEIAPVIPQPSKSIKDWIKANAAGAGKSQQKGQE